jgi:hypothetical protein
MNVLVCGRMKEGKTTLAKYLAFQFSPGVVIWDPRHIIDGAVYVHDADELQEAIDRKEWRQGAIVFRPNALHLQDDFDAMCEVLFDPPERFSGNGRDNGGFALIIDEAAQLQSPHTIRPNLDRAVRQHPRTVLVIQTTHSLQDWHRASKDLMSKLYCFRMLGRSLDAVVEYCDEDEEFRETVRTLPSHCLVVYDFEAKHGEETWTIWYDPAEWYSPINKRAEVNSYGNYRNSGREAHSLAERG